MADPGEELRPRKGKGGRWVVTALLVGVPLAGVQAATVDCRSDAPVDKLVCSTPRLLSLDREMTLAYEDAKKQGKDPAAVMQRAREDLTWRNAHCQDVKCLDGWYRQSIDTYRAYAKGPEMLTNEWIQQRDSKELQSASRAYRAGPPRGIGGSSVAAAPATTTRRPAQQTPTVPRVTATPSNVAVGQCHVVRGMMASVPIWRDNGVPMSRAWFNVAGALSPFAPDPGVMRQWERAVSQIYGSSITSADLENRYQSLCEPYRRLAIPAPLPR